MSDLTFSNLVVGQWYKYYGQFRIVANSSDPDIIVDATHDSSAISRVLLTANSGGASGTDRAILTMSKSFQATDTTLTFVTSSASATSKVEGDGTDLETWVQLTEIDPLKETTEW
jgi:hypothetical protein